MVDVRLSHYWVFMARFFFVSPRIARFEWFVLASLVVLAGCATPRINYREVTPPAAAVLQPITKSHPVVALVLGGGASRGFAHVGVIKVLEQAGIVPDLIVGTSAGSFVGALYAGNIDSVSLQAIAIEISQSDLRDTVFPDRGFVRGELLQDFINTRLDNRSIEQLNKRFAAVSTDLASGESIAFNRGNTGMAVRASSAIPGVFQPVQINGREYVDGGLVSPVPVRAARKMGADIVIAVDVSRKPAQHNALKSMTDILRQAVSIMTKSVSANEIGEADVIIHPAVNEISALDFERKMEALQLGEQAAREVLPQIRELIRQKTRMVTASP